MEEFTLKNGSILNVRRVEASDYDSIVPFLEKIANQCIWTNQYPNQPKKDREKSQEMYEDENNYFVAAFEGEKIVALVSV